MEIKLWRGLKYWKTGEWQAANESLKNLTKEGIVWNPGRKNLFRAMDLCPLEQTKVCVLAQDPYPDPAFATGLALDIGSSPDYPPSMRTIIKELKSDLEIFHGGNLEGWAKQGILLWNCIPTCESGKTLSHDWCEWEPLTREVIEVLNTRNIVFVPIGSHAKKYFMPYIDAEENEIITVDHPSPQARNGVQPFEGSRLFSTINVKLVELGYSPIDWRL